MIAQRVISLLWESDSPEFVFDTLVLVIDLYEDCGILHAGNSMYRSCLRRHIGGRPF